MAGARGAGIALVILCGVAAMAPAARAEDPGPVAVVEKLDAALVGMLRRADELGFQGRVAEITPVVNESYDVPFMAEKSIGQRWKDLDEADRRRWIELSREFSAANYAANFDHDSGQTIRLLGEEPAANDTVIVRTRIEDPSGDPVDLGYRLHRTPAGWRIIDVYLKGTVSELALRRADYASVLEREGFAGLASTMRSRIDDLAAGRGRPGRP